MRVLERGDSVLLAAAKFGRHLLRGHLHRRFPRHDADRETFGVTLDRIKNVTLYFRGIFGGTCCIMVW
jgi:hypothetical protein